jgi:hypothetical protein
MDVLCKWHVIVKYILNHDAGERFFPIMTCSFWLSIVLQSIIYIAIINPFGIRLDSNLYEVVIVAFFFYTTVLFHVAVKNELRYKKAEDWFINLNNCTSTKLKVWVSTLMLLAFFTFMPLAIFLM